MKKAFVFEIIALCFMTLFLYTGISKLIDFSVFREQLSLSPIFRHISGYGAILIPFAEIFTAVILFIPATRYHGFLLSLILMFAFTLYIIYIINFNSHLPCTCGGIIQSLSWSQHLIVNLILILLACLAIWFSKRER